MGMHTSTHRAYAQDLQTEGRTIVRWTRVYDLVANVLSLGHEDMLRQATVARAGVQPGQRILDIGCGTGSLTLAAARRTGPTGQVFGIDASPAMIEVAARKRAPASAQVSFRAGLIERLEFPDQSFDLVLSSLMMHHLPAGLQQRGLLEIRRVLKPGGRVFIVDFTGGAPAGLHGIIARLTQPGAGTHAAPQNLAGLLAETGYVSVSSGPLGMPGMGFTTGQTPG